MKELPSAAPESLVALMLPSARAETIDDSESHASDALSAREGNEIDPINFGWRFAKGLAMNQLQFATEGAAVFMGVANGDQMGMDPLTDETHALFYGQAVVVLRSKPGASGSAALRVSSDDDLESTIHLRFGD